MLGGTGAAIKRILQPARSSALQWAKWRLCCAHTRPVCAGGKFITHCIVGALLAVVARFLAGETGRQAHRKQNPAVNPGTVWSRVARVKWSEFRISNCNFCQPRWPQHPLTHTHTHTNGSGFGMFVIQQAAGKFVSASKRNRNNTTHARVHARLHCTDKLVLLVGVWRFGGLHHGLRVRGLCDRHSRGPERD